jgi:NADPH2:quinone reductase
MNAAVVNAFGTAPRYTSFADPVAAEGEVMIQVKAAGLHPIVRALANGTHYGSTGVLPFVPGVDGVGQLEDGTRVFFGIARSPFGSFAERAVTRLSFCLPLPDSLDDHAAAGLGNPGMSSWAALTIRTQLKAGENVLILGATGVAGQLSVQIAKRLGARRVIAAGRNPEALEKAKSLGADAVVSLEQDREALIAAFRREWTVAGVDVVLDYLWGDPAEALLAAISQKGLSHAAARIRYLQIGSSAGEKISLAAATLRSSGLELLGSGFGSASIEQIMRSVAEFLKEAGRAPFQNSIRVAPLRDIESLWSEKEKATRLVFTP